MKDKYIAALRSEASSTTSGSQAGVRHIVEAVSTELVELGRAGTALQAMLTPTDRPDREGLQALDLFTQRLFALAEFLASLTPAIDVSCQVDPTAALSTVCLSDMARRLTSASYAHLYQDAGSGLSVDVEAGVMDLF